MPKLLIKTGEKKGFVFRLTDQEVLIGRAPTNTIVLSDSRVSRSHASIVPQAEQYVIKDLGSVNGTHVNNKIIEEDTVLKAGDELKLGSTRISFLPLRSPEVLDEDASSVSQISIIPKEKESKELTVEHKVSAEDSSAVSHEIKKEDTAALHKAYLHLITLYRVSHELGSIVNLQEALNKILRMVLDIMKADRGFIMLVDDETKELVPQVSLVKEKEGTEEIAVSKTIINQIMQTGKSILTSDAMQDDRFKGAESIVFHGIRSSMCVPLKFKDEILGIMGVDSKGQEVSFSKEDLELLTAICGQAAITIANAKLFEDLKEANVELKMQQKQLIEAEKLSAIGKLASGVAHEINNPLTSILGYSELSSEQLSKGQLDEKQKKECIEFLKIVRDEAHHCKRIAQSLLQFSRRQKDEMAPVDVNKSIEAALIIAKFHIKKVPIEIKLDLKDGLPEILGDANQLQQVFLNLIVNARDAMEKGGKINISTCKTKEDFIEIKFSDTGCGIPDDRMEEIFKPLYTSKEEGKGTGLGLSISQDIIERHKGTIKVESTLGKGTTFIIQLPVRKGVINESK